MATINENLLTLANIKSAIKTSITNKGVTPGDDLTEYGNKIREIVVSSDNTDYLCFEAKLNGSAISLSNFGGNTPNIEYSFDKSTWTTWNYDDIDLNNGDKVYLRGNNASCMGSSQSIRSLLVMTGRIAASGNIMTLVTHTGTATTVNTHGFYFFFASCTSLIDASYLKMPATTLSYGCYWSMFNGCSSLTCAPAVFPALFLPERSCCYMFMNCSSLRTLPYIMATNISGTKCLEYTFVNCAPAQYLKADFSTSPSTSNANGILDGCGATGCFMKASTASWTAKGTIPSGWTLITSVS